jgi:hypothetical protein
MVDSIESIAYPALQVFKKTRKLAVNIAYWTLLQYIAFAFSPRCVKVQTLNEYFRL